MITASTAHNLTNSDTYARRPAVTENRNLFPCLFVITSSSWRSTSKSWTTSEGGRLKIGNLCEIQVFFCVDALLCASLPQFSSDCCSARKPVVVVIARNFQQRRPINGGSVFSATFWSPDSRSRSWCCSSRASTSQYGGLVAVLLYLIKA